MQKYKNKQNYDKNTLGKRIMLVHYVNVSNNALRGKDELQSYIENIGKQFNFDDVVNVYVPRVCEPTHIEHLVN